MQTCLDKLVTSKNADARNLHSFLRGMIMQNLITAQLDPEGLVVPWSSTVKLLGAPIPYWEGGFVSAFTELSGAFMTRADKDFDTQVKHLLGISGKRTLIFDLDAIHNMVTSDDMSFLYQSGLSDWFKDTPSEPLPKWLISVYNSEHICIYQSANTACHVVVGKDTCHCQTLLTGQECTEVMEVLAKVLRYLPVQDRVFRVDAIGLNADHVALLNNSCSDMYQVEEVFGQLFFNSKRNKEQEGV